MSYYVPKKKTNIKRWKGQSVIDKRYWITSILAKRRSGKTVLIYNLIRKFTNKNMIVLFFVSTFYNDDTYREIESYLKKHNIIYHAETSIFDESGNDLIREFIQEQNTLNEDKYEEEEPVESVESLIEREKLNPLELYLNKESIMKKIKKKKKKKQPKPEYLIIFDDLSHELRSKSITLLAKNSRHYRLKMILSSQDIKDLTPSTHEQIDLCFIFKNTTKKRLHYLHDRLSLWDSFEHFLNIYDTITKKPYGFLTIDRNNCEYRDGLFKKIK